MKTLLCLFSLMVYGAAGADARFGTRRFIEYQAGELPIVIAAPHGGREKPADLPDRSGGVLTMDANTEELARTFADALAARCGARPHLVICHLHRSKLDANRELAEAAEGHGDAEQAWHEHHGFIAQACRAAVDRHGWAFLIDLHGHSHPVNQIELGWLHSPDDLALPDEDFNRSTTAARGSAELLARRSTLSYSALLRGPGSLGALLEDEGFPATPSPRLPAPVPPYFRGGYTILRHCDAAHGVAGVQIEANRSRLRDSEENRQRFAVALATALTRFLPAFCQSEHPPAKPQK